MHANDLLVDDGRDRQAVEAVGEGLPQLDRVPPLALVVEAVDPVDRRALVVAAQQEEVLGVLHLVPRRRTITSSRSSRGRRSRRGTTSWPTAEAARLEDAEEAHVLAVDAADDLHWRSSSSAHGWFIRIPRAVSSTTSISFSVSLPSALSRSSQEFADLEQLGTTVSTISSDLESPITARWRNFGRSSR